MPLLKALQRPLAMQVLDLRSTVTKEAMSLLVALARTYQTEFAHNCQRYMSSDVGGEVCGGSLFKQLNNGKKIIAELADDTITQIMQAVCLPK